MLNKLMLTRSILVTMRYNLARVCEASFEFDRAETLYKEILIL
jgi:hypothetical protein